MSSIRQEARKQSAEAGKTGLFGPDSLIQVGQGQYYDSSLAAQQRRAIRHAKEDALAPFESTKAEVEQELGKIEKRVLWIEKFENS